MAWRVRGRRSWSVRAGTRKMVNYARVGRSQRKLWWRSVAVLTCKSIVKLGYRGERTKSKHLGSWFPITEVYLDSWTRMLSVKEEELIGKEK